MTTSFEGGQPKRNSQIENKEEETTTKKKRDNVKGREEYKEDQGRNGRCRSQRKMCPGCIIKKEEMYGDRREKFKGGYSSKNNS